jgi:long-chain acyl-CoA synthetase
LIQNGIDVFREGGEYEGLFPSKWLPTTFAVLGDGFTEQNKFLNSTLKMVRNRIAEFYHERLNYLCMPDGKNIFNHQNLKIIERLDD